MPVTTGDQSLTVVGAFADPFLQVSLPIGTSIIQAQVLWSEANASDGGIQVGLSCSPAPSFLSFATPASSIARSNGQTVSQTGVTAQQLVLLYGTVTVAAVSTLTLIRGLAAPSANPTTMYGGSFMTAALQPALPTSPTGINVRLFGVTGTVQLPSVHQRQWQADSVQALMYPYQWRQLLVTAGTVPVQSVPNPDPLVRVLRVEVQDGSTIRFEVTPAAYNTPRLAGVNSPRMSGNNNIAFGPMMTFSMIDASAVTP